MRKHKKQKPARDYRCVRYEECLSRAAHKEHGQFGFDCSKCGKFEMQTENILFAGIDSERYSTGFHRRGNARDL